MQQTPKHCLTWHLFVVQRYSLIQVLPLLSPQNRRCLEIKIMSKQQDQIEHPQTPSLEIFLTSWNNFTIPFLTHSTSPPNQMCAPTTHFTWKAGKTLLIFRMALLKISLLSLVLESTQYLFCTNCIHFGTFNTKKYNLLERKKVLWLNDKPSYLWWAALEFENKIRTRMD